MQAPDIEPPVAPTGLADEDDAEASLGDAIPQLKEMLGPAEETARGMLEAEEALRLALQRFAQNGDPEIRGEVPAETLDHVERQLQLTRERRRQLDRTEAKLWTRQNRLEGFLIHTRGSAWWHARTSAARTEADGSRRTSVGESHSPLAPGEGKTSTAQ